LLSLEVQEYKIISGDICIDPAEKLQQYLDDWEKYGHKLVFIGSDVNAKWNT